MAKKGAVQKELGARERQIMHAIFALGEASVSDVHKKLQDPPSYSAVRTMIRLLESKGLLKHRQEGTKYVYRPIHFSVFPIHHGITCLGGRTAFGPNGAATY